MMGKIIKNSHAGHCASILQAPRHTDKTRQRNQTLLGRHSGESGQRQRRQGIEPVVSPNDIGGHVAEVLTVQPNGIAHQAPWPCRFIRTEPLDGGPAPLFDNPFQGGVALAITTNPRFGTRRNK
jgi:hypothetical protein